MKQGWYTTKSKNIGNQNVHYVNNIIHRDDGPAITRDNGDSLYVNKIFKLGSNSSIIHLSLSAEKLISGSSHNNIGM